MRYMYLNRSQIDTLSKYLSDLSKILFASTVLGFFIPSGFGPITIPIFILGALASVSCFIFSITILNDF